MKIVITGSSGLIGSALVPALRDDGHTVLRLVRRPPAGADELRWDPPTAHARPGRAVRRGRGGQPRRRRHRRPAVDRRAEAGRAGQPGRRHRDGGRRRRRGATPGRGRCCPPPPSAGTATPATRTVDESAPAGHDFLADLCRRWEAATRAAAEAGVRVAHLRSGLVCGPGGLLGRLLPLVRLGLGAPLGSGRQWWSWISLADEVGAIRHVLGADGIAGPVNLTGPEPVTNREFTTTLGRVLHRPVVLPPVPRVALRLAIGEFADVGVVAGQRVLPRVLQETGYRFRHETVEQALRWATGSAP